MKTSRQGRAIFAGARGMWDVPLYTCIYAAQNASAYNLAETLKGLNCGPRGSGHLARRDLVETAALYELVLRTHRSPPAARPMAAWRLRAVNGMIRCRLSIL